MTSWLVHHLDQPIHISCTMFIFQRQVLTWIFPRWLISPWPRFNFYGLSLDLHFDNHLHSGHFQELDKSMFWVPGSFNTSLNKIVISNDKNSGLKNPETNEAFGTSWSSTITPSRVSHFLLSGSWRGGGGCKERPERWPPPEVCGWSFWWWKFTYSDLYQNNVCFPNLDD